MVAILFENKKRLPLPQAVAMAKRAFTGAEHTQGVVPRIVIFNPVQKPEVREIDGLLVQVDEAVLPNRIRICDEIEVAEVM